MSTPYQPLLWTDAYATGVSEIDEQHMILVHTLNEAGVKLANNPSHALLEQITQDLLSYALYHFDTEEGLMQEYGYPDGPGSDMVEHLEQHRSFSAKVVAVREGLKDGVSISSNDLLDFLNTWLVNHILNTDKKLGAYIIEKRSAT
jgi:hemerythrin-like metal-binding protein